MSDYLLVFRGRDLTASPEQMQRTFQKWTDWFKELNATNNIRDSGHPLEPGGAVVSGKSKVVTDGPFAELKDVVSGYIIVCAADLAQATVLAKGCPILEGEGSVEVRPVLVANI